MNKGIDLSIIVTAHAEGIIAHKTILSILKAVEQLPNSCRYEIIVHIDTGLSGAFRPAIETLKINETVEYFKRHKSQYKLRIFKNSFGSVGKSRNAMVQVAKGQFLAFINADDLISKNFFVEALHTIGKNTNCLIHPEQVISFYDNRYSVYQVNPAGGGDSQVICILLSRNLWPYLAVGHRSIFEKHPYEEGLDMEDYAFNIATIEQGIEHLVAPGSFLLYRGRNQIQFTEPVPCYGQYRFSLLQDGGYLRNVLPYSKLFDFQRWQNLPKEPFLENKEQKQHNLKTFYINLRNHKTANKIITPLAEVAKKVLKKTITESQKPVLNEDAINELRDLHLDIESLLPATKEALTSPSIQDYGQSHNLGSAYYDMTSGLPKKIDYIFFVPWISTGGADKAILNYLKALNEIHPKWNIMLITADQFVSDWINHIPDNTHHVDFMNCTKNLSNQERDILLSRLIIQSKCKKFYICNSYRSFAWIKNHLDFLQKRHIELDISYFTFVYEGESNGRGHILLDCANPYIISCHPIIHKVLTDNKVTKERLVSVHGFNPEQISVHNQPITSTKLSPKSENTPRDKKKFNILWAGRIHRDKNPEILLDIIAKLDPKKFHIDIYGKIDPEKQDLIKQIEAASNKNGIVSYRGYYEGMHQINVRAYDCYLFTSFNEGMPNSLLEIGLEGIPIIASSVGGVKDFINGKELYAIKDYLNADAYTEAIEYLYLHPEEGKKVAKNMQRHIAKEFTWKNFIKKVQEDL